MTSRDFCYWLQGFFEIQGESIQGGGLTHDQANCVRKHLAMVFQHEIDPSFGGPDAQAKLNELHEGVEQAKKDAKDAKAAANRPRPNPPLIRC